MPADGCNLILFMSWSSEELTVAAEGVSAAWSQLEKAVAWLLQWLPLESFLSGWLKLEMTCAMQ